MAPTATEPSISPGGDATAGIRNRFAAGAVLCEDLYEHFSGEIRYQYQDGHPFLSSGAVSKDIQGQSHTLTYDALFQIKRRSSKIRPFIAAGVGGEVLQHRRAAAHPAAHPVHRDSE